MKRWMLGAVLAAAGSLAACGDGVYYARFGPPPPPVVYARPVAPGPGYGWVEGYYRWGGSRYSWVSGRYERIPRGRSGWAPGYWAQRPHGYVWVNGHWR